MPEHPSIAASHPASPRARREMRVSITDGTAWAVMVGLCDQYFPLFVLALGLGDTYSGLVAALPSLVGGVLQMGTNAGVRRLGSVQRWVVLTALVQALSFLPLIYGASVGALPGWALFASVALYQLAGMTCGSAWSTLIARVIPARIRPRFFAPRHRWLQVGNLTGVLIGAGILLALGGTRPGEADSRAVLTAFAIIFSLAGVCRVFSSHMLAQHHARLIDSSAHRRVGLGEIARRMLAGTPDGRLLVYLGAITGTCFISFPYIPAFVTRAHGFEFWQWIVLHAALLAGKGLTMHLLGPWVQRHGSSRALLIGGLMVVPISWLWCVSVGPERWALFAWFGAIQVYSGVAWAFYDLSMFLMLLQRTREDERTSISSVYFLVQTLSQGLGVLVGYALFHALSTDPRHPGVSAYLWVLGIGSGARALTIPLLLWLTRQRTRAASAQAEALAESAAIARGSES